MPGRAGPDLCAKRARLSITATSRSRTSSIASRRGADRCCRSRSSLSRPVDDRPGSGADVAISMDMGHDVMPQPPLVPLGRRKIDRIDMLPQFGDLLGATGSPSSASASARATHSRRQVLNFAAGSKVRSCGRRRSGRSRGCRIGRRGRAWWLEKIEWALLVHGSCDAASSTRTISSSPARSSSSNRARIGLSTSSTPSNRSPRTSGTTISDLDALSQEICPANFLTFSTTTVWRLLAAAPQTPFPGPIRLHAGRPRNGPGRNPGP